jgi:hypothetical protein
MSGLLKILLIGVFQQPGNCTTLINRALWYKAIDPLVIDFAFFTAESVAVEIIQVSYTPRQKHTYLLYVVSRMSPGENWITLFIAAHERRAPLTGLSGLSFSISIS